MAARNMRADYSPEVREAIAAGALTYKELNGLYCRFESGDYGDVDAGQIPANREALRARSGNVWSLYHTEAGRNSYLIQFFSAPEDIGHFCYEGELRFMRER